MYIEIYTLKWQIEKRVLIDAEIPGLFFNSLLYDFMDFFYYEHKLLE